MTCPAPYGHQNSIRTAYRRKTWGLFIMIVTAIALDALFGCQGRVAQAIAVGAVLNFIMQVAFMWFGYQKPRHNSNQIMSDMALAVIMKWVIAIVGFAYIFKATTLLAPAVFAGFLIMQGWILISLFRLGR